MCPVEPLLRGVDQAQAAERQSGRIARTVVADVDQLEAAAAEIAGDAIGL